MGLEKPTMLPPSPYNEPSYAQWGEGSWGSDANWPQTRRVARRVGTRSGESCPPPRPPLPPPDGIRDGESCSGDGVEAAGFGLGPPLSHTPAEGRDPNARRLSASRLGPSPLGRAASLGGRDGGRDGGREEAERGAKGEGGRGGKGEATAGLLTHASEADGRGAIFDGGSSHREALSVSVQGGARDQCDAREAALALSVAQVRELEDALQQQQASLPLPFAPHDTPRFSST